MNESEIKEYLKENLSVSIDVGTENDYGNINTYATVTLFLDGKEISSDTSSI